jgi:hypothetical protein
MSSRMNADRGMPLRGMAAYACLVLLATGCGGGALTLSEYSEQGSAVTAEVEERIVALDAELDTLPSSPEGAASYWERRLEARIRSMEGLDALDPPVAVAELHDAGLDLYAELIAAEGALALVVSSSGTPSGPDEWWETAEGEAVRAVEAEIVEFCRAFQAHYDETIDRMISADVPWIPSEMKEIVRIDIGCQ